MFFCIFIAICVSFYYYLFIDNDESLKVFTNRKNNELYLLKYQSNNDFVIVNSLKEGIDLGYPKGYTIKYKVDTIEDQKQELERYFNSK